MYARILLRLTFSLFVSFSSHCAYSKDCNGAKRAEKGGKGL